MLELQIPMSERYDEENNEFVVDEYYPIQLEHSLVSLSKWEQKHERPFLDKKDKSWEETLDYIQAMSLVGEIPPEVFANLTEDHFSEIGAHINAKMSATWFSDDKRPFKAASQVITSEIIYYWMLTLNIDMECENWHLNRLLTLIRVTNEKNQPTKKMSANDLAARNRELNAKRKAQMNSRG